MPAEPAPSFISSHARYAAHTARMLGYDFKALDVDGYLFEVRDGERRGFFSAGAGTPYALNRAHANAIARDKAFAQTLLAQAGLPTIPSRLFFTSARRAELRSPGREPEDALHFAAQADYPLFLKPIDGAQGAFAEIVRDAAQFQRYLTRVASAHYAILAQPYIEAPECRVLVLRGEVLVWYRKLKPTLIGDGVSTLSALRRQKTADENASGLDTAGVSYAAEDVPPKGAMITLQGAANRALGGGGSAPEANAPAYLAQLARACAAALDLDLAAIDIFDRPDEPLVIEVNCNPAIQTFEDHGRWDLIETIWRANYDAALR